MITKSNFINFEQLPDGNLKITLNDEGRDELIERKEANDYYAIWEVLMEDTKCNGSYGLVAPEQIGALTDSPIIADSVDLDDNGNYIDHPESKYWWYPNYMVVDELQELLTNGEIIFTKGF